LHISFYLHTYIRSISTSSNDLSSSHSNKQQQQHTNRSIDHSSSAIDHDSLYNGGGGGGASLYDAVDEVRAPDSSKRLRMVDDADIEFGLPTAQPQVEYLCMCHMA
jgi:hypothetical protein